MIELIYTFSHLVEAVSELAERLDEDIDSSTSEEIVHLTRCLAQRRDQLLIEVNHEAIDDIVVFTPDFGSRRKS